MDSLSDASLIIEFVQLVPGVEARSQEPVATLLLSRLCQEKEEALFFLREAADAQDARLVSFGRLVRTAPLTRQPGGACCVVNSPRPPICSAGALLRLCFSCLQCPCL